MPWETARPWGSEHPRVGGEHRLDDWSPEAPLGTPPRRRGAHERVPSLGVGPRNTPASVGSTDRPAPSFPRSAEHPRVGGEHRVKLDQPRRQRGAPPRWRGGLGRALESRRRYRNTPAMAGRTSTAPTRHPAPPEHPCDGGEDAGRCDDDLCDLGTPPRWRGGLAPTMAEAELMRNTPRWRGGRGVGRARRNARRNTPAMAGRTPGASSTRWPSPEHPRDGGEDRTPSSGR